MFQIRDQACKGYAALWATWYWKNSHGSSNWKDVERERTKGLELDPPFFSIIKFLRVVN